MGKTCFFVLLCNSLLQLGLSIPPNTTNAAYGKRTNMSSERGANTAAANGVNGLKDRWDEHDGSSVYSGDPNQPWWYVDLGAAIDIRQIVLYNRNGEHILGVDRIKGFNIFVSNSSQESSWTNTALCYKDTSAASQLVYIITCMGSMTGRYVVLKQANYYYLNFRELEVYVCNTGLYGNVSSGCIHQCSDRHCQRYDDCPTWTGRCSQDGCAPGYFGIDCTEQCPERCVSCARYTGSCQSCQGGFYNISTNCQELCSDRNCVDPNDCPSSGQCDNAGCEPQWAGADCRDPCPANCNTCARNDTSLAGCTGDCLPGWFLADCRGICPGNCKTCARHTGRCLSCSNGTFDTASNCSHSCDKQHCVDDACDVTGMCTECIDGWYGPKCLSPCPHHCEKCTHNGVCEVCQRGYYNEQTRCLQCLAGCDTCHSRSNCSRCFSGSYDSTCSSTCNHNCAPGGCDQGTAACLTGCMDGWEGKTCSVSTPSTLVAVLVPCSLALGVFLVFLVGLGLGYTEIRRRRRHSSLRRQHSINRGTRVTYLAAAPARPDDDGDYLGLADNEQHNTCRSSAESCTRVDEENPYEMCQPDTKCRA